VNSERPSLFDPCAARKSETTARNARSRTYPNYKDSGIEWLGQIPDHWEVRRLKDHGVLVGGAGFPHEYQGVVGEDLQFYKVGDLRSSSDGHKMHESPNSVSRTTATRLRASVIPPGAILWAKIGAALFLNRRRVTARPCCIDNNLTAYIPDGIRVSTDWAFHWTNSLDFGRLANPGAVPSLSEGYQSTLPLIVPPVDEQQAIADFLDHETAKIDALVEKKERLIELLREKRTALITHAVTKGLPAAAAAQAGLDPNVPMRDSGIEWLGQIPAHWEMRRLKFCIQSLESGVSVNAEQLPADADELGILKTSCVYGNKFSPGENKRVLAEEICRLSCEVVRDSIIISRMNTPELVGHCGYVEADYPNLFLPDRLWITRFWWHFHGSVKHFWYVLSSQWAQSITQATATGTSGSMKNLTHHGYLDIHVPVPGLDEQQLIVRHIDQETAKIDSLIAKIGEAIERLKEYRTALISAAVTGKIDVRGT